jgi:hypothetical protein
LMAIRMLLKKFQLNKDNLFNQRAAWTGCSLYYFEP